MQFDLMKISCSLCLLVVASVPVLAACRGGVRTSQGRDVSCYNAPACCLLVKYWCQQSQSMQLVAWLGWRSLILTFPVQLRWWL